MPNVAKHNHLTRELRPDRCDRCYALVEHREELLKRNPKASPAAARLAGYMMLAAAAKENR